jgi:hypothetical protein
MTPLEKLIMKKREQGTQMDPIEQHAKMGNLQSLRDEMASMMKGDLEPKAKVEVAGDSPEAIKMGLDKAKDVVDGQDSDDDQDDDSAPGKEHSPMDENDTDDGDSAVAKLSPEEMELLQKLLAKMQG